MFHVSDWAQEVDAEGGVSDILKAFGEIARCYSLTLNPKGTPPNCFQTLCSEVTSSYTPAHTRLLFGTEIHQSQ